MGLARRVLMQRRMNLRIHFVVGLLLSAAACGNDSGSSAPFANERAAAGSGASKQTASSPDPECTPARFMYYTCEDENIIRWCLANSWAIQGVCDASFCTKRGWGSDSLGCLEIHDFPQCGCGCAAGAKRCGEQEGQDVIDACVDGHWERTRCGNICGAGAKVVGCGPGASGKLECMCEKR